MRGLAVAISSRFETPSAVSSSACSWIGRSMPGLRLELGEQPVHVVDVPRALDLRDHDHVELVADLGDDAREVVEHPRRLERVDPRPQLRVAEVHLAADGDESLARGLLALDRHGVLEVAEQDVDLLGDVGRLGDHLLVGEVEEVDHPRRRHGILERRVGRADGQRLEEGSGVLHRTALRRSSDGDACMRNLSSRGIGAELRARRCRSPTGVALCPRYRGQPATLLPRQRAMPAPRNANLTFT